MRRLIAMLLLVPIATLSCASGTDTPASTTSTTESTAPDSEPAIDVLGSWIVKDQSADQYSLTFQPDSTFSMKEAGTHSTGTYAVGGETVTLVPTDGEQITLKYVKGSTMMQDQLVGDVTWIRV